MAHSHCNHGNHDHDHGSGGEIGVQYNLFEKIDKENLHCLNESVDGSGKTVFKPWETRLDTSQVSIFLFNMGKKKIKINCYVFGFCI